MMENGLIFKENMTDEEILKNWEAVGLVDGMEPEEQMLVAKALEKAARVMLDANGYGNFFHKSKILHGYKIESELMGQVECVIFPVVRKIATILLDDCKKDFERYNGHGKEFKDIEEVMFNLDIRDLALEIARILEIMSVPMKIAYRHLDTEAETVRMICDNYCNKVKNIWRGK